MAKKIVFCILTIFLCSSLTFTFAASVEPSSAKTFSIAVIPDTQNLVDYTHQKTEGFKLDAYEIMTEQFNYIASQTVAQGGDIVFVTSVGDIWQHWSKPMDEGHRAKGVDNIENPYLDLSEYVSEKTLSFEIPKAIEAYKILAKTGIPFGVVPGNHDYDALWSVKGFPPNLNKKEEELEDTVEDVGLFHFGGLESFTKNFGANSQFFKDKSWYVSAFNGGSSSAQKFTAGGYTFLHFSFEMQPSDEVLAWAESVMKQHPGVPTMMSTHDYLNPQAERKVPVTMDLKLAEPDGHNLPEDIWQKFLSKHDQIFLVMSGHYIGQATRIDKNIKGHKVYQLLSNYQNRGQAGVDAGQSLKDNGKPVGLGDGWFRIMTFDLQSDMPSIKVTTYSSHYKTKSSDLKTYAKWYKNIEQPKMSDGQFYAEDDFIMSLDDFYQRFGKLKKGD